jgi:sulfatase maturation enzyme AslB (radical SAM superfamily)
MTLSSWVPALFSELEQRIQRALGLDDRVRVVLHSRETRAERRLVFTVALPTGLDFELELADAALGRRGWQSAGGLELFVRAESDAVFTDPATAPSLRAIGQLFQRRQRQCGGTDAVALWAEHARLQPVLGLDDSVYRRIFDGVQGRTANLRLGFRCNQDCGLCWQSRQWPEPPPELYALWLDELAEAGVHQLTISGGEPTLHRRLPELLHRAKSVHGMRTMLQTNAVQLAKPAVLQRVVAAAPDRLFVSLHAAEAELSDHITRAPGTWARTVRGIEGALQAGLRVGLNTVVDQLNVAHLPALARFIAARFVRGVPDNPVESWTLSRPQTYFDRALWHRRLVSMEQVGPAVRAAVGELQPLGVVLDITSGSCGLPACVLADHPELIWLPAETEVGMADPGHSGHPEGSVCRSCALGPRCQGPGHGYRAAFGEAGLRPFGSVPGGLPTEPPLEL